MKAALAPDIAYLDGSYLPRAKARIPPDDRGFLFGDGVYEMTPAYGGNFLRMERHLARLRFGLGELGIDFDVAGVRSIHEELLDRNGLADVSMATVYFQVTRGAAPRSHHFPAPGTPPTVYAFARPFEPIPVEEWVRGFEAITHPDRRWGRVDVKTLQLLPNVMAQQAAREAGVADALMVRDGVLLEGAVNNLFFVFGKVVRTHPTSNQILPGITRELVLELARAEGFEVEERPTPLERLGEASEVFLTGTTTEVRPLVRIDGVPVGNGVVGPVATDLYRAFQERVAQECGRTPVGRS